MYPLNAPRRVARLVKAFSGPFTTHVRLDERRRIMALQLSGGQSHLLILDCADL